MATTLDEIARAGDLSPVALRVWRLAMARITWLDDVVRLTPAELAAAVSREGEPPVTEAVLLAAVQRLGRQRLVRLPEGRGFRVVNHHDQLRAADRHWRKTGSTHGST